MAIAIVFNELDKRHKYSYLTKSPLDYVSNNRRLDILLDVFSL